MSHVDTIGVRELRQYASHWLARVKAGETFVDDRSWPTGKTAFTCPGAAGYERLEAEGRMAQVLVAVWSRC